MNQEDTLGSPKAKDGESRTPTPPPLSLWLVPRDPRAATLRSWIHQLSDKLDGPKFEPHVTLLGRLPVGETEAREKCRKLARGLSTIAIETQGVAMVTEFYRALVLPVFNTPELWQAHLAARQTFAFQEPPSFFPHLSLYYGFAPRRDRLQALEEVVTAPSCEFTAFDLQLIRAGEVPEQWGIIDTFPLTESPRNESNLEDQTS